MEINFMPLDSDFCGYCGSILPIPTSAPSKVTCKVCTAVWHVKAKANVQISQTEKVYERTVADTENAETEGADAVVEHICSKCGHNEASYSTMQTRSADEGQTVFYTCLKCKKKDIEYS